MKLFKVDASNKQVEGVSVQVNARSSLKELKENLSEQLPFENIKVRLEV